MAASSGGDGYRDDERAPMKPLREQAGATGNGARSESRSLDEILPDRGNDARSREMQAMWQAFRIERHDMVLRALDSGRTAPEIAYQLGEVVHTYFRPRGLTLTGQELRRLVADLLQPSAPAEAAPSSPEPQPSEPPFSESPSPEPPKPGQPPESKAGEDPASLVTFGGAPEERDGGWTGDEWPASPPDLSDKTFAPPPSTLVTMTDRTTVNVDRLLGRTLELAKPRLALPSGRLGRDEALRAIDAAVDEVMRGEKLQALAPEVREQLVLMALSDICGLGLIDRLWADHSVHAVFVNGPKSVFVERESGLGPASEVFRDQAHLLELVNRLVTKPASGVAEFHLRDGSTGTVVFPPAAPDGPVLTIRRSAPGSATLGRLVSSGLLDLQMAGLLRVAARARLNTVVLGPAGAGKSALLAAIARDLDPSTRLVTLSRHRDFDWSAPGKVELVVSREAPYPTLLVAGEKLQPETFILDSFQPSEAQAVLAVLERGAKGLVMACDSTVTPLPNLTHSVDLVVRLGRGRDGAFQVVSLEDATGAPVFVHEDGQVQCRTREPAFARKVRDAGFGEALATLLR